MANLAVVMSNRQPKTLQPRPRLLRWLRQQQPLHTVVAVVGCAGDDDDAQASIRCPQPSEVAMRVEPTVTKRDDVQDANWDVKTTTAHRVKYHCPQTMED